MRTRSLLLALVAVTLALPSAAAASLSAEGPRTCVPRLIDEQDLVCSETHYTGEGKLCWNLSVNPPRENTYYWNTLCTPIPCPPWLCAISIRDLPGIPPPEQAPIELLP
ncbi:MAG TPA: hypothetical protein VNZ52_14095 [Candidatus Thermoplasmatota archaeon]|nr:hypothetical protein [Candidatus Thermoplasmatota archaeon]